MTYTTLYSPCRIRSTRNAIYNLYLYRHWRHLQKGKKKKLTTKHLQSYPLSSKWQLRKSILMVRSGGLLSQRQVALLPLSLLLLLPTSLYLAVLGFVLPGSILLVRLQAKALLFIDVTIFLTVLIGISPFKVIKCLTLQLLQKKLPLVAVRTISLSKLSILLSIRYWWTRLLNPFFALLRSSLVCLVN